MIFMQLARTCARARARAHARTHACPLARVLHVHRMHARAQHICTPQAAQLPCHD